MEQTNDIINRVALGKRKPGAMDNQVLGSFGVGLLARKCEDVFAAGEAFASPTIIFSKPLGISSPSWGISLCSVRPTMCIRGDLPHTVGSSSPLRRAVQPARKVFLNTGKGGDSHRNADGRTRRRNEKM